MDRINVCLDISKTATGVCVTRQVGDTLKIEHLDTFRIKSPWATKLHFLAKEFQLDCLSKLCRKMGIREGDPHVSFTLEHPIYGDTSGPIQFFMYESFVEFIAHMKLDLVSYSVPFLKSFIVHTSGTRDPAIRYEVPDKDRIRDIYRVNVYPFNKGVLPNIEEVQDDNQMDALFLGLCASALQTQVLDAGIENLTWDRVQAVTPEEAVESDLFRQLFLTSGTWYHQFFLANPPGKGIMFAGGLDHVWALCSRNRHLMLCSPLFYPFFRVSLLEKWLQHWSQKDWDRFSRVFCVLWRTSPKHLKKRMRSGKARLSFGRSGSLILF